MRLISACLALSLTGVMAASLPAAAGDLNNGAAGGMKDYGYGGTPVPAPMPYEETYKWYLRGDIGTGFKSAGTIGNDGLPVSLSSPNDWRELSIMSVGFGRYITPSLRSEFTMDIRPQRTLATGARTPASFSQTASTTTGVITTVTNIYANNAQVEDINYTNNTFLASAFYDFNHGGRFKPYVGAGIGVAYHQLTRNGGEGYNCSSGTTTVGAGAAVAGCSIATGLPITYSSTAFGGAMGYGLAAQLSAGLSFDVSPRVHWDTGYRMLWQSGHVAVASTNGLNSITLGDHTDHEVRTGLRWDLW